MVDVYLETISFLVLENRKVSSRWTPHTLTKRTEIYPSVMCYGVTENVRASGLASTW